MEDLSPFIENINRKIRLSPENMERLTAAFRVVKVKRKQLLIQPGFVAKLFSRSITRPNSRSKTVWSLQLPCHESIPPVRRRASEKTGENQSPIPTIVGIGDEVAQGIVPRHGLPSRLSYPIHILATNCRRISGVGFRSKRSNKRGQRPAKKAGREYGGNAGLAGSGVTEPALKTGRAR